MILLRKNFNVVSSKEVFFSIAKYCHAWGTRNQTEIISLKYVPHVHQYIALVCMTDSFMPHSSNHEPLTTRTNCGLLNMSERQNFNTSNLRPWVGYNTFLILLTNWWLPLSVRKSYKWSLDSLWQKKNDSKSRWSCFTTLAVKIKSSTSSNAQFHAISGSLTLDWTSSACSIWIYKS